MVTFLDRRGRLPELKRVAQQERSHAVWPSPSRPVAPPLAASPPARLQLSQTDFERLVGLLASMPEFRTAAGRVDFLDDVFAGSPRKDDVLTLINLDGNPRGVAVRVITRLTQFGQAEPGRETLGVLINKLLSYIGGGADADFLRGLFDRYPLAGVPVSARGVADWRGREQPRDVQEKIIGENTLRDVRLLELALEASRGVIRIVADGGMGSGFLVGEGLVMTNHHVIGSRGAAQQSRYEFNYQLDKRLQPTPVTVARALADGLFYTNPKLDITVVEVENQPASVAPLTLTRLRAQRDERVNIIQHPGGHYKKISMQNNFVAFANARSIQYLTSTEPGSSGSPVFNNDFVVVGIHHSGGNLLEPDTNRRYLRNAGSSMIAILDDLQANAPQIYEQLQIK
ncbi:MAG: trypsin-like peptidase domain-containing protein [Chloroflexi bacterium]|nr:trypsin-like peptidase domain-containing protein [Chloroflexota bacterium]